jgi:hypothetical protein
MGEGEIREILSVHPCGTSRVLLRVVKCYDMGPSRFTSHPRGRCAADFIAFKNPPPWPGFEPATFGSSGQHTNHYMMFRAVFWVILPCRMIVDRRFRGAYCLHHHHYQGDKLKFFMGLNARNTSGALYTQ